MNFGSEITKVGEFVSSLRFVPHTCLLLSLSAGPWLRQHRGGRPPQLRHGGNCPSGKRYYPSVRRSRRHPRQDPHQGERSDLILLRMSQLLSEQYFGCLLFPSPFPFLSLFFLSVSSLVFLLSVIDCLDVGGSARCGDPGERGYPLQYDTSLLSCTGTPLREIGFAIYFTFSLRLRTELLRYVLQFT